LLALSVRGRVFSLQHVYPSFWTALRHSDFKRRLRGATAGFASTVSINGRSSRPVWMLFCAASPPVPAPRRGIKMIRAELMVRKALREIMFIIHPRAYLPVKLAGQRWRTTSSSLCCVHADRGGSVIAMTMLLVARSGYRHAFSRWSSASAIPGRG